MLSARRMRTRLLATTFTSLLLLGAAGCEEPPAALPDAATDPQPSIPGGPWQLSITTYDAVRGVQTEANASLLAFRDGDGDDAAWQLLDGNQGAYVAQVAGLTGRYTVVTACERTGHVRVVHAVVTDGLELHLPACVSNDAARSEIGGPLAGAACARVHTAGATQPVACDATTWTMQAADGLHDLIALDGPSHDDVPEAMFFQRDLLLPAADAIAIDFDGPSAGALEAKRLNLAAPDDAVGGVSSVTRRATVWLGGLEHAGYGTPAARASPGTSWE
jgi:hypothetical protein